MLFWDSRSLWLRVFKMGSPHLKNLWILKKGSLIKNTKASVNETQKNEFDLYSKIETPVKRANKK